MLRFVVVGTMLRGSLEQRKPVDDAGQEMAFAQWLVDDPQRFDYRAERCAALRDAEVVWTPEARVAMAHESNASVCRMMQLAQLVRVA
ncbi:hypothetical protein ACOBR2_06570 [Telmatobacter bradus]|uniref:hypothetical protein n=1 Tax=Telmatobacter bradus TaxID=474953 RepID=UPI003B432DB1